MSRTLNDIITGLPEERRQSIEARAATLLEQEILRQLRKALGLSQKDLAGLMHITQHAVSKLERICNSVRLQVLLRRWAEH